MGSLKMSDQQKVRLAEFRLTGFDHGRSYFVRIIWFFVNALVLQNPLNPLSGVKRFVLKLFGAKIGVGVNFKPRVNVKHPWRLIIGDYVWIGEGVWIDNLECVTIGSNCCISQGAYLCTGNHDWTDPRFSTITRPIVIEDGVWVGACAIVLPGVTMASHSIVAAGSVLCNDTQAYMIYQGNPAVAIKERRIVGEEES